MRCFINYDAAAIFKAYIPPYFVHSFEADSIIDEDFVLK